MKTVKKGNKESGKGSSFGIGVKRVAIKVRR